MKVLIMNSRGFILLKDNYLYFENDGLLLYAGLLPFYLPKGRE